MALQSLLEPVAKDSTSAAIRDNVATAIARLEDIKARLPAAFDADDGGVKVHVENFPPAPSAPAFQAVTGPLTNTELRAARVPVDGSGVTQPISASSLPLPTGAATDLTLAAVRDRIGPPVSGDDLLALLRQVVANTGTEVATVQSLDLTADQIQLDVDGVEAKLDSVIAKQGAAGTSGTELDYLAQMLAKLSADPATQTTAAAILAKLSADPATQTTLAAVLAKLSADPSTGAKQDALVTLETAIRDRLPAAGAASEAKAEAIRALLASGITVSGPLTDAQLRATSLPVSTGLDLSALATGAKQDTENTSLASILAKLTADPSTSAKQDTGNTTLAALNAKVVNSLGLADSVTTKTLTNASSSATSPDPIATAGVGECVIAVRPLDQSVAVRFASGAGTVQFEVTWDNGANWSLLVLVRLDSTVTTNAASASAIFGSTWGGPLPRGITHFRARCSAFTTAIPTTLAVGPSEIEGPAAFGPTAVVNTVATGSSSLVGYIRSAGVWQDDTTTNLAGNAVFTGSSRDLIGNAAAAIWTASAASAVGAVEVRFLSVSDQPGTLCLEISRDAFTTTYRVASVAASNVGTDATGTGTLYVATMAIKPAARYARVVYVNGSTLQTKMLVQSILLSA